MPSPIETHAEAHFLALWGSLLSAGISEAKIYEILSKEAGHQTLKVLATSLREEIEESTALSAFFDDPVRGPLLRPWVQTLLFQCENGEGDCEALGESLVTAASILQKEANGRSRTLFWRKVQLLHSQKIEGQKILEILAKDAQNAGEEDFAETLHVATRLCRNGKSLPAALAKSAKSFLRSEKLLLASAIGSDDLDATFERLCFLADLAKPRQASPSPTRSPSPENTNSQSLGETSAKVKKTISGALSSVGDLLGLNADRDQETPSHHAPTRNEDVRVTPRSNQPPGRSSVEATRDERRDERRRRAEQAAGSPRIRVNVKRGDSERVGKSRDPNESSTELRAIQKTIGPAWMTEDGSNEGGASEEGSSKTIGFSKQATPAPEKPRPAVRVTITAKNEPAPEIHGPVTIDKLRSYLLLLQDSPQHTIIADQVAEGIVTLRKQMGDDYDPSLEADRRDLDDLELAFGSWKAQHGR
ncbi:MAG: hypothetical protein P1V97_24365 [Planctomycetota bacterium]|nr:hypothetical protein [Planctomycetota bacterium]